MKLFITLWEQQYVGAGKYPAIFSTQTSEERLLAADFCDCQLSLSSKNTNLDQQLDEIDVDLILNPDLPNLGGMEVFAQIKQNLLNRLDTKSGN